jgi:deazaflavin-dependent oxidoreductase (nitroreductase family)
LAFPGFKRWLYQEGRPNRLARAINRFYAVVHSLGVAPNRMVTLEVVGRRSGRTISLPLAMVVSGQDRYLVSMLGENASWVHNVRAAHGKARLRHGKTEDVELTELPIEHRAPILKAYLEIAPGARPHFPVDKDAPLDQFEKIASKIPVFKVRAAG